MAPLKNISSKNHTVSHPKCIKDIDKGDNSDGPIVHLTCLMPCFSGNTGRIPRILSTNDRYVPWFRKTRKLVSVATLKPISNHCNIFSIWNRRKVNVSIYVNIKCYKYTLYYKPKWSNYNESIHFPYFLNVQSWIYVI